MTDTQPTETEGGVPELEPGLDETPAELEDDGLPDDELARIEADTVHDPAVEGVEPPEEDQ